MLGGNAHIRDSVTFQENTFCKGKDFLFFLQLFYQNHTIASEKLKILALFSNEEAVQRQLEHVWSHSDRLVDPDTNSNLTSDWYSQFDSLLDIIARIAVHAEIPSVKSRSVPVSFALKKNMFDARGRLLVNLSSREVGFIQQLRFTNENLQTKKLVLENLNNEIESIKNGNRALVTQLQELRNVVNEKLEQDEATEEETGGNLNLKRKRSESSNGSPPFVLYQSPGVSPISLVPPPYKTVKTVQFNKSK
jgi:hypothetical protein